MESLLTRKYSIIITLLLLAALMFLWTERSRTYQKNLNNLYVNGLTVIGYVTDVVDEARNEGNIHSWHVYYRYQDMDSVTQTGVINDSKDTAISIGDPIYIRYSAIDTKFHVAALANVEYQPIGLLSAMFTPNNMLLLIGTLILAILILTQAFITSTCANESVGKSFKCFAPSFCLRTERRIRS